MFIQRYCVELFTPMQNSKINVSYRSLFENTTCSYASSYIVFKKVVDISLFLGYIYIVF
jgi:hypothetical protein